MPIGKLILLLAASYAAVVALAWAAQGWLLFPTRMAGETPPLPPGAERLACDMPDGERLHGIRIPAAAAGPSPQTVRVIGFGGNAWNAGDMAIALHQLHPAAEVIAFHYRGYRPSSGTASAAALLADAMLVHDCAQARLGPAPVIAVGFSIGSAVAARLARERAVRGLILVTPFDSLERLARHHYRWLPVGLLLRHRMTPAADLRSIEVPVALIAAGRDTIVPAERTAPLRQAARNLVLDRVIEGAGHNGLYADPAFVTAMRQAIRLMSPDPIASAG